MVRGLIILASALGLLLLAGIFVPILQSITSGIAGSMTGWPLFLKFIGSGWGMAIAALIVGVAIWMIFRVFLGNRNRG